MDKQIVKLSAEQFEGLVLAYENSSIETPFYLDLQTGEVKMLGDYADTDPELEEGIEDEDDEYVERYIKVPQIQSRQSYEDMVEFTDAIKDKRMRESLERALSGSKGVFRRFKDALSDFPALAEEWYSFQDQRNRERLLKLLEVELIQVVIE